MIAIARNVLTIFTAALIVQLLAQMTLGNNEIYQLGASFGEALRATDDDLDPKDLDYELQLLAEQMGTSSVVDKLLGSDDFLEGATFGYYKPEILGQ
jgi:hypothetical protein